MTKRFHVLTICDKTHIEIRRPLRFAVTAKICKAALEIVQIW